MELVLNNPFRVLGLSVMATNREIAKRVSDLEMFAELGKEKSYPLDLSELGEINRSLESVKDAARRIELPEMRVFYSFFWFRSGDAVDELALECLSNYELTEAGKIWSKKIVKAGGSIGSISWRINAAVFNLFMSRDQENGSSYFEQALSDYGLVVDGFYKNAVYGIPDSERVSATRVRERVVDVLIDLASKTTRPYGLRSMGQIEHWWTFRADTFNYIKARLTKPLLNSLQDAINRSKAIREDGSTINDLRRKNGLSKVEHIVYELRDSLGESNPTFQAASNSFAKEVVLCSINAIREHRAVTTAIVLAEWSAELPSYGHTRGWLMEQRRRTLTWDPNYEPEESLADASEDCLDSEGECDMQQKSDQNQFPDRRIICPKCNKSFVEDDVKEFTDFGVRCPDCNQSIVVD